MRKHVGTLIILIVFVGLPAALITPNFLTALNRSRQRRTMADMRTIATAWEAYATDMNHYSVDGFRGPNPTADVANFEALHRVHYDDLRRALRRYAKQLPQNDAWGVEFELRTGDYKEGRATLYAIRSPGSDRRFQKDPYVLGTTARFEDDLVLSLGNFVRYPGGT